MQRIIKYFAVFGLASGALFSQSLDQVFFAANQPYFKNEPITNFGISYLGLEGTEKVSQAFSVTLINQNTARIDNLRFRLYIYLQADMMVSGEQLIYKASSGLFSMEPGEQISMKSYEFFNRAGTHKCRSMNTEEKLDEKDNAVSIILNSGKMPTGKTTMKMELCYGTAGGECKGAVGDHPVVYEVINIQEIFLSTPGAKFTGFEGDVSVVFTTNPQFSWMSDIQGVGYPAGTYKYELSVYKKEPWMSSEEEIVLLEPVFRIQTNENVGLYPPAEVLPLEEGATYCWQVRVRLRGPLKDAELASEVFAFKIGSMDQRVDVSGLEGEIIGYLKIIVGPENFHLFGELEGFKPDQMVLDNKFIGVMELEKLAKEFKESEYFLYRAKIK